MPNEQIYPLYGVFSIGVNHNKYTVNLNNLNKIILSLNIFYISGSPRIKIDSLIVHDANPQMPFLNCVVINKKMQ